MSALVLSFYIELMFIRSTVKLYQARIKHSNNDDERVGPMLAKINRFHHAEDKIIEGFSHKVRVIALNMNCVL